jgi:hypothetical protein
MLPDRIHFVDGGAGGKQEIGHALLVGQRHALNRSGPECRAAPGDETQEQVVGFQRSSKGEHALSALLPGLGWSIFVTRTSAVEHDGTGAPRSGVGNVDPSFEVVALHVSRSQGVDEPLRHFCSRLARSNDRDAIDVLELRGLDLEGVAPDAQALSKERLRIDCFDAFQPDGFCVLELAVGFQRILPDFLRLTLLLAPP